MTCCGFEMAHLEVFGIRVYSCTYRSHHPRIYVRQSDGKAVAEPELEWHNGGWTKFGWD